jgi:hypothetical protein
MLLGRISGDGASGYPREGVHPGRSPTARGVGRGEEGGDTSKSRLREAGRGRFPSDSWVLQKETTWHLSDAGSEVDGCVDPEVSGHRAGERRQGHLGQGGLLVSAGKTPQDLGRGHKDVSTDILRRKGAASGWKGVHGGRGSAPSDRGYIELGKNALGDSCGEVGTPEAGRGRWALQSVHSPQGFRSARESVGHRQRGQARA